MLNSELAYNYHCSTPSDIHEHLPTLRAYAQRCDSIAELGVRTVVSTWAFLHAGAKVVSYDIAFEPAVDYCKQVCQEEGLSWDYRLEDTRTAVLPFDVDMLFVDTIHTYGQVKAELAQHAGRVAKYIAFHDTVSFGEVGMGGEDGVLKAIREFLDKNPEWVIVHDAKNNNGLIILEKFEI